ncbi:MAG: hypothetical protein KIG36_07105 [Eubacteriales bacterium]|nr:hypothetical protein [Eubacteriales bacterium]
MEPDFDDFLNGLWSGESAGAESWIEWVHRSLSENHCSICLSLDKRWFSADKHPLSPQHPHCHCILREIPYGRVRAEAEACAPSGKFDRYLFNPANKKGFAKGRMFISWGFSIGDTRYLQEEIERQGLEKYKKGEYKLGKLDEHGQRISIRVELDRKDGAGKAAFITGWLVYPKGFIQLATPYGGK